MACDNDRDMIETVAKWLGMSFMSDGYFLTSGCEKAVIDKLDALEVWATIATGKPQTCSLFIGEAETTKLISETTSRDNCQTIAHALTLAVWRAIKAGKIGDK